MTISANKEAPELTALREKLGMMDRREAIRRVTLVLGGVALVGGSSLLDGCRPADSDNKPETAEPFTADDVAFLDEMAETMLPETSTPGAKAARVGAFMALMVTDAYNATNQGIFRDGMRALDAATKSANGVTFRAATAPQRLAVLEQFDREQRAHSRLREEATRRKRGLRPLPPDPTEESRPDQRPAVVIPQADAITADTPPHFFRLMKELALLGYFTSEIGCTQAQRYIESPGRFDPCVELKPGDKSWAPHA
ncbi:MAG TPA: gluconate 2-dehydrogenase subunit 3 family protein [Gemmatimonadaceae bacterium]|nr:gluconate 2-dehydrogenase subunit 3 family protein [Gemmatimonadaceae bacterium]